MDEFLKKLDLTERDFNLLIQGLEAIHRLDVAGDIFIDFYAMVASPEAEARERMMQYRFMQKELMKPVLEEKSVSLQRIMTKIVSLRRYIENQSDGNH